MTEQINYKCTDHPDPYDCPDHLIVYRAQFDEYGIIIHDGSSSIIEINFCPWCGTELPKSKRYLWYDQLNKLGFENPGSDDIPQKYNTDEWYHQNEN